MEKNISNNDNYDILEKINKSNDDALFVDVEFVDEVEKIDTFSSFLMMPPVEKILSNC